MKILHPPGWPRPKGYSHGIEARGRQIFIGGQLGQTADQRLAAPDICGQLEQVLRNIVDILAEAGAGPEHVVRMTWYVTDMQAYLDNLSRIGEVYRSVMGPVYPAMALFQIVALVDRQALIEIETTAVVPD